MTAETGDFKGATGARPVKPGADCLLNLEQIGMENEV